MGHLIVVSDSIHGLFTGESLFVMHTKCTQRQTMTGLVMRTKHISIFENGMTMFAFVFKQRGNDRRKMSTRNEHSTFAVIEQIWGRVARYLKGTKRCVFRGADDAGHFLTTQSAGIITRDGSHPHSADGTRSFVVAATRYIDRRKNDKSIERVCGIDRKKESHMVLRWCVVQGSSRKRWGRGKRGGGEGGVITCQKRRFVLVLEKALHK